MIGVVAREPEQKVVREFFELFKTPWEFYREGSVYDAVLCAGDEIPSSAAKLILLYSSRSCAFDREQRITQGSERSNRVLLFGGERIPIYHTCRSFAGVPNGLLIDETSREAVAVEQSSNGRVVVRIGFDLFAEVRHLLSSGQCSAHASVPTLELHITVLRELMLSHSVIVVEIPPVPAGHEFIACLTHDVDHVRLRYHMCDHTMFGFLYRSTLGSLIDFCRGRKRARQLIANWKAALALPFVYLGWTKDYWDQFQRYLQIEDGRPSTFFFIPVKDDTGFDARGVRQAKRAAKYGLADVAADARCLRSAGSEIAVHGIDAWRDSAKGRLERERIEQLTETSNPGVRMHWLFFGEHSPMLLEEAGFTYDSTVGFNDTVGFRAGTAQVFKPLTCSRLLELPMQIMDTALFYPSYLHLSEAGARAVIAPLVGNVERFGGVLTINWHDRSLGPERLWERPYVDLVASLHDRKAWFATASDAVSWFRKRRSASIHSATREGENVRIKLSSPQEADDLPGLRIRVHRPRRRSAESRHPFSAAGFTDLHLGQTNELLVAA